MNDPRQLVEASDPMIRDMLAAAIDDGPPRRARHKAWAALGLGPLVAVPVTATAGTAGGAAAAGVVSGATVAGKWIGIALLVGGASGGLAYVTPPPVREAPAPVASTAPRAPLSSSGAARAVTSPRPRVEATNAVVAAPPSTVSTAPRRPKAAPPPAEPPPAISASTLAREIAALDVAGAALRANDPPRALAALDDFARAFPDGALAPEATVMRIDALTRLGDPSSRASADRLGEAFLRDRPRSLLAARVRSLLGGRPGRTP